MTEPTQPNASTAPASASDADITSDDTETANPLRVLVVDDQALMRSGFSLMLSAEDDLVVIGEAADGQQAIAQTRALHPDVVLMDVQMPGMDGIAATREIAAADLAKVLILTTFDRDDYLFDALAAGASGFLLKNSDPEDLVAAVRAVGHGHALLAPEVTRRVITQLVASSSPTDITAQPKETSTPVEESLTTTAAELQPIVDSLTEREREVLAAVARGLSNAEIAAELVIGESTVKTHVSSVLAKAHLRDRVQAVVFAFRSGIADG